MIKRIIDSFKPKYLVFRRYIKIDGEARVRMDQHFVKPFRGRRAAQEAIKKAKDFQPWQEFIILRA